MSRKKTDRTNSADERKRTFMRPWVRALAAFLAVLMVLNIWLAAMIRVKESGQAYVGEFLELAKQTTDSNTDYLRESDFQRIRRVLKYAIGKPRTCEDYETYASVAIAQEDYEKAVEYLSGCIETYEGGEEQLAVYWLRLGSLQMLCGEEAYADAKESFTSAVTLDPTLASAWLLRAQLELNDNDLDAAVADVTQYKAYGDDVEILGAIAPLYEAAGDDDSAIECYTRSLENPDGYDVEILRSRGNCYVRVDDAEKAVLDYERFFREGGKDDEGTTWLLLGLCRIETGRYGDALLALERAEEKGADLTEFYPQLVPCAYACDDLKRADKYMTKAFEAAKGSAAPYTDAQLGQLHVWKGILLMSDADWVTALKELETGIALDDSTANCYYYAATAAMSTEEYEKAIEYAAASIERGEEEEACRYTRGVCLVIGEEYEGALEDLSWVCLNGVNAEYVASALEIVTAIEEAG